MDPPERDCLGADSDSDSIEDRGLVEGHATSDFSMGKEAMVGIGSRVDYFTPN